MVNAHSTLIKLGELGRKLYIFPIDQSMGRQKCVQAGKFWKLPAQVASKSFGQSFTPESQNHLPFIQYTRLS